MRVLVTGAAGFIGSHLAEALVAEGHHIIGLDCFLDYYDRANKESNLARLLASPSFELLEWDLSSAQLDSLLGGIDVVFHQAGQPGVRASWAEGFETYAQHNILATQRLLEASRGTALRRFVYASSSSIYGDAPSWPTDESVLPRPQSPYGVTKLAAEHLCGLYARNYQVPTVSLRYFTVYGPRQRPDMATHRLIQSALHGTQFTLMGDGTKVRDFTYVGDVVAANLAAAQASVPGGAVLNIAGGSNCSMIQLIDLVTNICGQAPNIDQAPDAKGDVERTGGDTRLAHELLGWAPRVSLGEGLAAQVAWLQATGSEL